MKKISIELIPVRRLLRIAGIGHVAVAAAVGGRRRRQMTTRPDSEPAEVRNRHMLQC